MDSPHLTVDIFTLINELVSSAPRQGNLFVLSSGLSYTTRLILMMQSSVSTLIIRSTPSTPTIQPFSLRKFGRTRADGGCGGFFAGGDQFARCLTRHIGGLGSNSRIFSRVRNW
ncbi:predicted protein [Aspergillus terreus NIH2624]|uniref:Uncharacterized protein n=1 Tax=Aspergillus terreus (strain NIH 2624 / FGSC A1156) TaxID=341663 RepID=Q0CAL6_ASPTN|nr:uncharacterized protein ATEG_09268 [Aspergillus terreus NIH2624]EAU30405.1 predicted protein [Aspergillus terreus NIH2624]